MASKRHQPHSKDTRADRFLANVNRCRLTESRGPARRCRRRLTLRADVLTEPLRVTASNQKGPVASSPNCPCPHTPHTPSQPFLRYFFFSLRFIKTKRGYAIKRSGDRSANIFPPCTLTQCLENARSLTHTLRRRRFHTHVGGRREYIKLTTLDAVVRTARLSPLTLYMYVDNLLLLLLLLPFPFSCSL